jgi:hypothetical protein
VQPVAFPVTVTLVPTLAVVGGANVTVIPVHCGASASEYWNASKPSYEVELAASRAQTEKRYEPAEMPDVSQM